MMTAVIAVGPKSPWKSAYLLVVALTIVLALTVLGSYVIVTMGYYRPISLPREYVRAPLMTIITDLEKQGVIPDGTTWQSENLRQKRVTASWFTTYDLKVLKEIAREGNVVIIFTPVIMGKMKVPIAIEDPGAREPGLYEPPRKPIKKYRL